MLNGTFNLNWSLQLMGGSPALMVISFAYLNNFRFASII
jgi:hypothetical protein